MVHCSSFLKSALQRLPIEQRPGMLLNTLQCTAQPLSKSEEYGPNINGTKVEKPCAKLSMLGHDTHTLPHTAHFRALRLFHLDTLPEPIKKNSPYILQVLIPIPHTLPS